MSNKMLARVVNTGVDGTSLSFDVEVTVLDAAGLGTSADVDRLITGDRPDLTGGIHFVGSDRHSTYVEINAYRKHMTKVRKQLGWPDLTDGVFDRLRAAVPA